MSRTIEKLQEDGIWPPGQGFIPDPEESLRHSGIFLVLGDLPEDDYRKLLEQIGITWFIPHPWSLGFLFPAAVAQEEHQDPRFPGMTLAAQAHVLYLSPGLEKASADIVIAVVAHEVAHLVLGHPMVQGTEYEGNEKAAWELVAKWGYAKQAKAHARLMKWRDSYEQYQVKKLIEKQKGGEGA